MSFLNPLGLLGMISLPLIIGLHLFFERKQHFDVSSLVLWSFLDKKSHGSKPRRIKLSWLLLLDLLVAAAISLAFAQPQIKLPALFGQGRQVIILVDTSTSMLAVDLAPSRFAAAKADLIELIGGVESQSAIAVIALGNDVELVGDTSEISRATLTKRISELTAGGSGFQLQAGLALAEATLEFEQGVEVHIFTDGAFDLADAWEYELPIDWHFYGKAWPNQAVTDLQMLKNSEGVYQLYANILNHSTDESVHQIRVIEDGVEVHRAEVKLLPDSSQPYALTLHREPDYLHVELSGSDPLLEDNSAGIGYWSEKKLSVALVAAKPGALERALRAIPDLDLTVIDPLEYRDSARFNLTVFREFLPADWPAGSILVFDPPSGSDLLQVRGVNLINQPLEIHYGPITGDIDFAGVRWQESRAIPLWQSEFDPLVAAGEIPLLLQAELPTGNLLVFLPELTVGNLTMHPSFPLLISNVVETNREFQVEQSYLIGETIKFPQISLPEGITIIDPAGISTLLDNKGEFELRQFGRYSVNSPSEPTDTGQIYFGVNSGDYEESDLRPRPWTEDVSDQEIDAWEDQKILVDLTPWLLGSVIILLVLEAWRAWR